MLLRMSQFLGAKYPISLADSHSCVLVYVMPIGLANIGWKMYMINGSWDIVIVVLIVSFLPLPTLSLRVLTDDTYRRFIG